MPTPRSKPVALAALAVLMFSAAACGDDSDTESTPSSAAPTTAAPATSSAAPPAPSSTDPVETSLPDSTEGAAPDTTDTASPVDDVLEVSFTGGEFYFDIGEFSELPAGTVRTTFSLEQDSRWDHVAMWVRVKDGVTVDEVLAAAAADFTGRTAEPLLDFYGGSNAIGPGQSQTTILNLDPGTYLLADFIPAQDGTLEPHSARGMWEEITVTESDREFATIESDGEIAMVGMRFVLPDDFTGQGTYLVTNGDEVLHEMGIVKLLDGKTGQDVIEFFDFSQGPPSGPPPYTTVGGFGALSTGLTGYIELDLEPGNYAMISFITDESFQQQLAQGMMEEFTIT
jgi:hypothetical protein